MKDHLTSAAGQTVPGHTPGPWLISHRRGSQEAWISTHSKDTRLNYTQWDGFAVVYGCDESPKAGEEVMLANACLIAAAPELLAALSAYVQAVAVGGGDDKESVMAAIRQADNAARAAIAKATGEPRNG